MVVHRIEVEKGANVLILEDLPDRQEAFRVRLGGCHVMIVDSVADAIAALKHSEFAVIFLDHDLDGRNGVPFDDPNCGSRVAEYLAANKPEPVIPIIIQSLNPAGAGNMKRLLPEAEVVPGAWDRIVVV